MTTIECDIVDAYIFRRVDNHVKFLLMRRGPDVPMADSWQGVHGRIQGGESAAAAASREIAMNTGITDVELFSADFVSQFYDHHTDSILLAPNFAALVPAEVELRIAREFADYAWCDLEESTARLPMSNQRWAVRHIHDVIALGGEEANFYRL